MIRFTRLRLYSIGGLSPGRTWNSSPNWCSLCKEPYNAWDQHRGKRDHVCLELFFEAIVSHGRRWIPIDVWKGMILNGITWGSVHHSLNTIDNLRREKLLAVLFHLRQAGLLVSSFPECVQVPGRGMFLRKYKGGEPLVAHGTVLFHQIFVPPLLRLFPKAEAKQHTAFSQQVQATYNMETVWDLCQLRSLLPTPPGFTISFYEKGSLLRAMFGELITHMDYVPGQPMSLKFRPYLHSLAQFAVNSIMAEATYVKMMEYVSRVEPVWREYGQEITTENSTFCKPYPETMTDSLSYTIGFAAHKSSAVNFGEENTQKKSLNQTVRTPSKSKT